MEKVEHLAGNIFRTNKRVFIPFIDFRASVNEFGNVKYYIQRRLHNDEGVEQLKEKIK